MKYGWLLGLALGLTGCITAPVTGKAVVQELGRPRADHHITYDFQDVHKVRGAAEQGDARAQHKLGVMYAQGRVVPQDDAQAVAWYKKAAAQGYADAQINLDWMIKQGRANALADLQTGGTTGGTRKLGDACDRHQDCEGALICGGVCREQPQLASASEQSTNETSQDIDAIRRAAERGVAQAQTRLGFAYFEGKSVSQDYVQAEAWWRKAAEQGQVNAQFNLGNMYRQGRGVPQDDAQAVAWYRKAAAQGHAKAQHNLGNMYRQGHGVAQDDAQAVAWYRKAADQGLTNAQTNLDQMIREGRGQAAAVAQQTLPPQAPAPAPAPDATPPVITLAQGAHMVLNQAQATLSGAVRDGSRVVEVSLDGRVIPLGADGGFSVPQYFSLGETRLSFKAVDAYGNVATEMLTVERRAAATQAVVSDDPELRLPSRTVPPNPNALALIVGIEDYESAPKAQHAQRDAELFYDYAQRTLGVPEQNIKLLTGKGADRNGLLKAVKTWLVPMVRKDRSQVVVYFAGHGLASSDGERSFLIPQDGAPELLEDTALDRQQIFDAIAKADPKSTLLFFDTCYSGGARGGAGTLVASSRAIIIKPRTAPLPPGFVQFSAAGNAQLAISHPQQPHGLFSYYLMRGLSGEADANRDKRLTAGELHDFVEERVQRTAQSQGRPQVPEILGDRDRVIAEWR